MGKDLKFENREKCVIMLLIGLVEYSREMSLLWRRGSVKNNLVIFFMEVVAYEELAAATYTSFTIYLSGKTHVFGITHTGKQGRCTQFKSVDSVTIKA